MAGRVEYKSAVIAPGIRELDHASEILHSGEYINEETKIGIKVLSNLNKRGDFGARNRTARNRTAAAPQARMNTTFMGSVVSVACERNG
jgi:hypothetical protein